MTAALIPGRAAEGSKRDVSISKSCICKGNRKSLRGTILSYLNLTFKSMALFVFRDTSLNLNELQRRIVQAAIVNLQLRDKITVYRTSNTVETGMYIDLLYKKLTENPDWISNTTESQQQQTQQQPQGYNHLVKTAKRENLTPSVCQKVQLAQIPGVSASIADVVLNEYSSLVNLISCYQTLPENETVSRELFLSTLQVTPKRKLGKVLSARIYKYLFNINEN